MSSRRMIRSSTNQFSSDAIDSSNSRFRFTRNSYSYTGLILVLFRFQLIGGLMAFSNNANRINVSLIHYFLTSAFIILPIMYMYIFIGHYSRLGCVVLGRIVPACHGVGYTMIVITALQAVVDLAVACDSLIFFKESLSAKISFMDCKESWGNDCIGLKEMAFCKHHEERLSNKSQCNYTQMDQLSSFKYRVFVLREIYPKVESRDEFRHFWKKIEGRRVIFLSVCVLIILFSNDLDVGANNKMTSVLLGLLFVTMLVLFVTCVINIRDADGILDIFTVNAASLIDTDIWFECLLYFIKTINVVNVCTVLAGSYMPIVAMSDLQAFVVWIGLMSLYFIGEVTVSFMRAALAVRLGTKPNKMTASGVDAVLVLFVQFLGSCEHFPQLLLGIFLFVLLSSSLYRIKIFLAAIYHTIADDKPVIRVYSFYIRIFSCFMLAVLTFPICVAGFFRRFLLTLSVIEDILSTLVFIVTTFCVLYVYGIQTLFDDHHFTYGSQPAIFFKITLLLAPVALIGFGAKLFVKVSELFLQRPIVAIYVCVLLPLCLLFHFIGLLYIAYYYLKRQNMAHLFKCEEEWGDPNPSVRKQRIIYHPRKETNYFRRIDVCKHNCLRHNKIHFVIVNEESSLQNDSYRNLDNDQKIFTEKELGIQTRKVGRNLSRSKQ